MAIVPKSSTWQAVMQYFKSTTLHGFKYLLSEYNSDRIGWVLCCCASACCAGVLCALLWERFIDIPAILVLYGIHGSTTVQQQVPVVIVCPEPKSVVNNYFQQTFQNSSIQRNISNRIDDLFFGKSINIDHQAQLIKFLNEKNLTLRELMTNYSLNCNDVARKCRYQRIVVPCADLFVKSRTMAGICCVMRPNKLKKTKINTIHNYVTQMLDLVLQCGTGSKIYNCQFATLFEGEDTNPQYKETNSLTPGYFYMAQMRFAAVPEISGTDQLVKSRSCSSEENYSINKCMLKCAEKSCGCIDPLFSQPDRQTDLPYCPVTRMGCLRGYDPGNNACQCLPTCKKVYAYLMLESTPMNAIEHTIDYFYKGINVSQSTVVNIRVNVGDSRLFEVNPTETWLTLLSSLGGVFNMFLGVGLFSALELFYLVLIKLPIAAKKTSEIKPITQISPIATPRTSRF